jgi:hypothetical protein
MTARSWLALAVLLAFVESAQAAGREGTVYRTANDRWRASSAGFASWTLDAVNVGPDGTLQLDPARAIAGTDPHPAGQYRGRNFYNGGRFVVGEATGPVMAPGFAFTDAIASWNATTPDGSWLESQIRVRFGTRWSRWYSLGVWVKDEGAVQRHSVDDKGDADARVSTDTLTVTNTMDPADGYQLKLRLFSATGQVVPSVRLAAVAVSTKPEVPATFVPGNPAAWARTLGVPECSQMVYPDGGNVWCSPTSTSMVMAFWQQDKSACEPRVRAAVRGTADWLYDGYGNWPFNTAYAAEHGFEGWVGRFSSLAEAERWIQAGVPLVLSYGWKEGELTGAPIPKSGGHLTVLVGFDDKGNPVINDPAASSDDAVQRTYPRAQIEKLWLSRSGGTVYAIYPVGHPTP